MMTYKPWNHICGNVGYYDETKRICHNIKHLKELTNLSFRKLSIELGFKPGTLSNYVYEYVRPNLDRLHIIADYFGIEDIEDLCLDENTFAQKYSSIKIRA